MNLDELRSVQSKERQKDSLQHLRPSFYQEVGDYIAELENERDRVAERADDPFSSPEVSRLTDEIETAKDVVEAIYERRMGKLVKQASLAAAGMPADDEGLTAEETDLFEDLVERIRTNKTRVLDVLEGVEIESTDGRESGGPAREEAESGVSGAAGGTSGEVTEPVPDRAGEDDAPPAPPQEPRDGADADPAGDSSGISPADVMGGGGGPTSEGSSDPTSGSNGETEPTGPTATESEAVGDSAAGVDESAADTDDAAADVTTPAAGTDESATDVDDSATGTEPDVDRVTVRITRDVGSILGVDDREYALSSDDVVTLPEQNADPLVEREAAEPLE